MFNSKSLKSLLVLFLGACVSISAFANDAKSAKDIQPPEKPVGLTGTNDAVGLVDLAAHNLQGSMNDFDLRSRSITLAPLAAIPNHSHAGRPGIVLVVKGHVVEHRGAAARTLKQGESWLETNDVMHWFRNPSSTESAEIWVVDLVPKKK